MACPRVTVLERGRGRVCACAQGLLRGGEDGEGMGTPVTGCQCHQGCAKGLEVALEVPSKDLAHGMSHGLETCS